jgi:hypothetical protein
VTNICRSRLEGSQPSDISTNLLIPPTINPVNMAGSHQIAIAKASLSASLLRADPTPITRDEITTFHNLLDKALTICTPANIQVDHTSLNPHLAYDGEDDDLPIIPSKSL